MITSAQALEEIEAMEAHTERVRKYDYTTSVETFERALTLAREGWASSERYRGEVGGVLESCGATVLSYEAKLQAAEREVERVHVRAKTAETGLVGLTCNGSEFYLGDGDGFRVDVNACLAWIRRARDGQHATIKGAIIARKDAQARAQAAERENERKGAALLCLVRAVERTARNPTTLRELDLAINEARAVLGDQT